uniref:Pre-mRNA-splicing factor SLU7 n=1 Tax=Globodera rostochiensis TaxID=31243 RepID=A0A914HIL5_GLORO
MSNLSVSSLIRQQHSCGLGDEAGMESGKRKSKDEYRKQKDLEEQRKAGTAPAMVDVETGRDINPHIPEFIEKTPWYVPSTGPTLKHQRPHPDRQKQLASVAEWYPKGTTNRVAFKYRDGACENCGALGHSKKNCLEKPRLKGAKFTNADIAPDDHVLSVIEMGYDAKRDRWNGYNAEDYSLVAAEFEKMEETRKLIRADQLKEAGDENKKAEEDEDIYAEDASAPGQSVDMDSRTRITVRNLRIREDTAKYLYSLDPNGAYYDPKSRSMRENPYKNVPGKESEAAKFSGENFVRFTGEVAEANEAQVFAWQARCKGIDVHTLAEPTRLEALKREFEKQKGEKKLTLKNELLDKYGGEEHLHSLPRELLLAQTEKYVEYNRKGRVIKGDDRPTSRSRYEENVCTNNHSTVWGSYWRDGQWGYACCHQFLKCSYCIGEQGIIAERNELGTTVFAPQKGGQDKIAQGATLKLTPSEERSTSGEESLDEEEKRVYEEQLEKEKQTKIRDDKRRAKRSDKRRRHKEKLKKCEAEGKRGGKRKKREDNSKSLFSSGNGKKIPFRVANAKQTPNEVDHEAYNLNASIRLSVKLYASRSTSFGVCSAFSNPECYIKWKRPLELMKCISRMNVEFTRLFLIRSQSQFIQQTTSGLIEAEALRRRLRGEINSRMGTGFTSHGTILVKRPNSIWILIVEICLKHFIAVFMRNCLTFGAIWPSKITINGRCLSVAIGKSERRLPAAGAAIAFTFTPLFPTPLHTIWRIGTWHFEWQSPVLASAAVATPDNGGQFYSVVESAGRERTTAR